MQLSYTPRHDGGPLVLVVDDDQELRACLQMVLEDEGYTVQTAPNGAVALEIVQHYQPAAIVLDVQMPVMDGAGFVRAYHAAPGPHAPILLLTASCYAATRAAELGVATFLGKPFDLDDFLDRVEGCVRDYATLGTAGAWSAAGTAAQHSRYSGAGGVQGSLAEAASVPHDTRAYEA
jgi:CheY-like chemotaxis protein